MALTPTWISSAPDHLGVGQRQREHHGVAGRHVGDGDVPPHGPGAAPLGHGDGGVGEGRAAEGARGRPSPRGGWRPRAAGQSARAAAQLAAVALAVVDGEGVAPRDPSPARRPGRWCCRGRRRAGRRRGWDGGWSSGWEAAGEDVLGLARGGTGGAVGARRPRCRASPGRPACRGSRSGRRRGRAAASRSPAGGR